MPDDPAIELKTLGLDLKKATDEVKIFAEKAQTELKNLGILTGETKELADKALSGMNDVQARLTAVEQKVVRRSTGDVVEMKTLGEWVTSAEETKALMTSKRGTIRVMMERKDIMTGPALYGPTTSQSNALIAADRQPLVAIPYRGIIVRQLIAPGSTTSNAVEYPVETSDPMITNAGVVSEGAIKPTAAPITFDMKSVPVRTIAHILKASRQILDDVPMLQSYIDARLRLGLAYAEETELLYGDGTGLHLHGIIPQARIYAPAFAPSLPTAIDTLRLASLQATLGLYPASGYVMHQTDWAKIELLKDTLGRYIIGDPQGNVTPRLWGLPVAATQAMQVGHFLTGAFAIASQIFDRLEVEVMISTENADDFIRNMITIRGEERLTLAVYRPDAFITGPLPA